MQRTEKTVFRGTTDLATQSFGDPDRPVILMMMGATASMLWWPDELCELLAASGRHVIRYDNRDTGRSATGAPGEVSYTLDDLADDAIAILDGYGVERAHLVGMSLGAMIAQLVALKAPLRVASLTAISSSRFDEDDPNLPEMDPALLEHFATMDALDWNDRQAVVDFHVETFRISAGPKASFDAERARRLAEREYDRAIDPRSAMNHAMLAGGERYRGRLGEIRAPLLVLHGRHDPILSFAHGVRLAEAVPSSRIVELEEAGHELNIRDWERIVGEIIAHTAARG
ncbi:alpha/beta hydrolase [Parvibaculum sp.]|uniref:alpha/beta fold hydrolase n=1 Tax=Parvibaculum sp. TaxID=2024848 RepID=UPI002CDB17B0|nr:alpha/beta hydrolase [Parvibaculum sp.]HUD51609.1 alpha/beta hydrolase [Parvibaculum sp.]